MCQIDYGKMCIGTDCKKNSAFLLQMDKLFITKYGMNTQKRNQFYKCIVMCYSYDKIRKSFKRSKTSVPVTKRSKASCWKVRGRLFDYQRINFRLFPVPFNSAEITHDNSPVVYFV